MQDRAYRRGYHRAAILARIRLVRNAEMMPGDRLALTAKDAVGPAAFPQKLQALRGSTEVLNKVSQRVAVHRSIFK